MKTSIKFSKVKKVKSPKRGTPGSAGLDFFVPDSFNKITLSPKESVNIASGIKVNVPENHALIAFNKSGVALRKSLDVLACVVDSDYQGEIHLNLINAGNESVTIHPGDKLVQFLLIPVDHSQVEEVPLENLFNEKTERGEGGFGSTGNE